MQGSKKKKIYRLYNEVGLKADSCAFHKIIIYDKYNVLHATVGLSGKTDKQQLMLISGK